MTQRRDVARRSRRETRMDPGWQEEDSSALCYTLPQSKLAACANTELCATSVAVSLSE